MNCLIRTVLGMALLPCLLVFAVPGYPGAPAGDPLGTAIQIKASGPAYNKKTGTYNSKLILTNRTRKPRHRLYGSLAVVVAAVTRRGVAVDDVLWTNPTGIDSNGVAYLHVTLPASGLKPGKSVRSEVLKFTTPTRRKFKVAYSVYPGSTVTPVAEWVPVPGESWQIQLSPDASTGQIDTTVDAKIYDIDVFTSSAELIRSLHQQGRRVICYFSAGSYEKGRPDVTSFPPAVLGKVLEGWPDERWLDIRRLDLLMPIMRSRMELAKDKGCDAVDPDNVDGYDNNSGFPLQAEDQLTYNRALADAAHTLGMAVGLKNDLKQIGDLVGQFDFAVNEQCFEFDECALLTPFVTQNKPVFGIEYNLPTASFCQQANALNFDFLKKNLDLDSPRESCR